MNHEQEKALMASIEHKMENVLKSVHSRNSVHSQENSRKDSLPTSQDMFSPTTPRCGTSSESSETATIPEQPKDFLGITKSLGMALSEDHFEENFGEQSESERLEDGLPVDSLANFIPPADVNRKGSVRRKERGHITELGAEEEDEQAMTKRKSKGTRRSDPGTSGKSPRITGRLMKKITLGFRSHKSKDVTDNQEDHAN